ncbi:preprotein translocase subunit SecA [Eubacteriales bacterium OttesenSCG-928-N13]|nr:preprotein translocase subunit SecA [Eubacteriales bacterium OttesenSCG-928-N13]
MFDFIKKMLSGSNEAEVKKIWPLVDKIDALEPQFQQMSDEQLRGMTTQFRERYKNGETLDDLLPEAYAVVREGAVRSLGQRPFRVQMVGGIVLHQGRIAEMRTGEGKTLTAALPAYLNAIPGDGVHIVTVNDYLARFHSEWMGNVYRFLGMTVGLIVHDMESEDRQKAYNSDITYATNNELGFDYLRDNMATYKENQSQRPLNFAIVDEVDSILIDEARTPLIISGQGEKSTEMYTRADIFVQRLKPEDDYIREEKQNAINLTEEGARKTEQHFGIENLADVENTEIHHHVLQALRAHATMKRDVDYVVQNGEVVIVDEFTGRLMTGRRYSEGLHQAIEAKEHVKVARESKTLATVTFQNYFRMYKKLSGMTGTAKTEEEEFRGIYKLDVVTIPTNKPMIREDANDGVYTSQKGKYKAVVEEIIQRHQTGQPVLVGTVSVEKSEMVSRMLDMRGVKHVVLNAKFHEKEAEIVAQAGKKGAVTISTNMAGRGTDILLGGNAEFMARQQLKNKYSDELLEEAIGHNEDVSDDVKQARQEFQDLMSHHRKQIDIEHEEVVKAGGLHIIGTERHESRRIDNQLRGRAGRQGDPGSSQFFISLEDDLMRLFGSDRIQPMIEKLGVEEDQAIEYGLLSKQIENAQKRIESRNYDIRKNVLQFDDVMNQQRNIIYGQRQEVLSGGDMEQRIKDMRDTLIEEIVKRCVTDANMPETWDMDAMSEYLEHICVRPGDVRRVFDVNPKQSVGALKDGLTEKSLQFYQDRVQLLGEAGIDMREFERVAVLGAVDRRWMDHIDAMDQLRDGIGLRAYGHRDPFMEYKFEGFEMFEEMVRLIQEDTLRRLYFAVLQQRPLERKQVAKPTSATHAAAGGSESAEKKPVKVDKKVGRNDHCPCGSGKKYKECCGKPT